MNESMRRPRKELRLLDAVVRALAVASFASMILERSMAGARYSPVTHILGLAILLCFATDVIFRLVASGGWKQHLSRHWYELVVFVPLANYLHPFMPIDAFSASQLLASVFMLISRGNLVATFSEKPSRMLFLVFILATIVGAILLMLPGATTGGKITSPIDALFTATSALCVTGLAVQDTGTHFTPLGQVILVILIQLGGLGIMTFSGWIALLAGREMDVRSRVAFKDILDHGSLGDVKRILMLVVMLTVVIELAGGAILTIAWWGRFPPSETIFHAFFHAVSAFCNAGFSTFSDNLEQFKGSAVTNLVICFLIIAGGLGFVVLRDLAAKVRERKSGAGKAKPLSLHTKVVLKWTGLLIVAGTAMIYLLERNHSFSGMTHSEQILASLFQSVTARTAGFNTCNIGALTQPVLLGIIVLMFIGGAPASTAGGIKVTTAAVLWATVTSSFMQRERTEMYRRTIPMDVVYRAFTILCISLLVVTGFAMTLMAIENKPFLSILFEAVSAFGTVGLSTGITPTLEPASKLVLCLLMLIGRLGPLTVAFAIARKVVTARYEYAEERVMIG